MASMSRLDYAELNSTIRYLMFSVFAVAAVPLWRRFALKSGAASLSNPFLNRRTDALVGREFTLEKPIVDGSGTVRIDDTIWRVAGPDAPAGSRVRVVRADGAATRRDEDLVLAACVAPERWLLDHVARVVELVADARGEGKGLLESDDVRIPVHEYAIEIALHELDRLCLPPRVLPPAEDVAHRAGDQRPARRGRRLIEQGQQFEAHLPAAEREQFQQQQLCRGRAPGPRRRRRRRRRRRWRGRCC